ncbi:MBOAT family O-acyltransferase [Lutibacter flavus]|uniref:D-alanyl-lipoteichoic acid acyltransferase DltB, MBOAT superfamily n=1 Tax=Lutibacter flavus TaxID=691689 RepID=A0A238VQ72_9FLAO|nr:MBOAT family O-acyltransferase [Lutibacter flavus]SNR36520.1 D-alanyl-lipoteichoic acid acyltransferase DltB, MBOAT superfamily [Lutibacter flavus]
MLFNSIPFLVFLPIVFCLYWLVLNNKLTGQNLLLLIASYVFYGWWDYRFLGLIVLSTLVDFVVGLLMNRFHKEKIRKRLLWLSLLFNLGLLGVFKYFNFFIESWVEAIKYFGFKSDVSSLNIILPVGISFYTFQTLSYTIDVYNKKIKPTFNLIDFAAFVSFFPQLVAGPIERASQLLPQFKIKRTFDFTVVKSGIHLIVWGLFQKMVIADSCATYTNAIFSNYENLNSLSLLMGGFYFAFQIYGDFAGYSNLAIGIARMFGFNLMINFNYPYFSRDVAEFWRRWHISLTTWFRDYVYIPLGGSRGSKQQQIRNVFIVFFVSGLWHGANWTFLIWGGLHALFFTPLLVLNLNKKNTTTIVTNKGLPNPKEIIQIVGTFSLVSFSWIFFRSKNLSESFKYINGLFTNFNFKIEYLSIERYNIELLLLISVFLIIEWVNRNNEHPISGKLSYIKMTGIILMILVFGVYSDHQNFIYFQF